MQKEKLVPVLAVLLFISLSANLFIGAKMAGRFMHGPFMMRSLSVEDRAVFKGLMDKNRAKMEVLRDTLDRARAGVVAAAKKEPFDAKALDVALTAERDAGRKMFSLMDETRTEAMKKMSAEGRATLAEMPRGGFKGGRPPR